MDKIAVEVWSGARVATIETKIIGSNVIQLGMFLHLTVSLFALWEKEIG